LATDPAAPPEHARDGEGGEVRERILKSAFAVFMERGYNRSSTLEIATRAKVSKRELYALFGSKRAMLVACISSRASRMRTPLDLPEAGDRESLLAVLTAFGARILREVCHPNVTALFRLAILEVDSPEVGQILDVLGRRATRKALAGLLARAQAARLLADGDPAAMAGQFAALLWGDLRIRLLLGVCGPPTAAAMQRRARSAAEALLALHPAPPEQPPRSAQARRRSAVTRPRRAA
jgi:AcrR family transcriptional regulator